MFCSFFLLILFSRYSCCSQCLWFFFVFSFNCLYESFWNSNDNETVWMKNKRIVLQPWLWMYYIFMEAHWILLLVVWYGFYLRDSRFPVLNQMPNTNEDQPQPVGNDDDADDVVMYFVQNFHFGFFSQKASYYSNVSSPLFGLIFPFFLSFMMNFQSLSCYYECWIKYGP